MIISAKNARNPLFLLSGSVSRALLLECLGVPFGTYSPMVDERQGDSIATARERVVYLARLKSAAWLPDAYPTGYPEDAVWYSIAADTLSQDQYGQVLGKPFTYDEALEMIARQSGAWTSVYTGVCVCRYERAGDGTVDRQAVDLVVESRVLIDIAPAERERYLRVTGAMNACGAMVVDGAGAAYVRAIEGSYASIIGLPLYETKQALHQLGYVI